MVSCPPKKSECFNFMVILRAACHCNSDTCGRFDLFQHSEAPLQNCCSLRLRDVQFDLVTTPQFSHNFPTISHNFPAISPQFPRNFSQLDWTLPDRNPPPPPRLRMRYGQVFGDIRSFRTVHRAMRKHRLVQAPGTVVFLIFLVLAQGGGGILSPSLSVQPTAR